MIPGAPQLAWQVALAHSLPPDLVCAVCEQESAWNTWAVRYESAFMSRYIAPQYTAGKLTATEAYTRAMSWGLMQLMGETAREIGYAGPLPMLCDPEIGVEWSCRRFAALLAHSKGEVPAALLAWNGGANPNYAVEVLARRPRYTPQTVSHM